MKGGTHLAEWDDAIRFIHANLTIPVGRAHIYRIQLQLVDLAIKGAICERNFYRITSVLTPQTRRKAI